MVKPKILTQFGFIHNWVITGIQGMVHWWVLVHSGHGTGNLAHIKSLDKRLQASTCVEKKKPPGKRKNTIVPEQFQQQTAEQLIKS